MKIAFLVFLIVLGLSFTHGRYIKDSKEKTNLLTPRKSIGSFPYKKAMAVIKRKTRRKSTIEFIKSFDPKLSNGAKNKKQDSSQENEIIRHPNKHIHRLLEKRTRDDEDSSPEKVIITEREQETNTIYFPEENSMEDAPLLTTRRGLTSYGSRRGSDSVNTRISDGSYINCPGMCQVRDLSSTCREDVACWKKFFQFTL